MCHRVTLKKKKKKEKKKSEKKWFMRAHIFPLIASSPSYFSFNLHSNVSWEDKRNKKLRGLYYYRRKEYKKNDTSPHTRNNNSLDSTHTHIRSSKRILPLEREWSSGLFLIVCIANWKKRGKRKKFFSLSLIMKKCEKRWW